MARYETPVREIDETIDLSERTRNERAVLVLSYVGRIVLLLLLLYLFICSLGLLSDAFRLVGGKQAGCFVCAKSINDMLVKARYSETTPS